MNSLTKVSRWKTIMISSTTTVVSVSTSSKTTRNHLRTWTVPSRSTQNITHTITIPKDLLYCNSICTRMHSKILIDILATKKIRRDSVRKAWRSRCLVDSRRQSPTTIFPWNWTLKMRTPSTTGKFHSANSPRSPRNPNPPTIKTTPKLSRPHHSRTSQTPKISSGAEVTSLLMRPLTRGASRVTQSTSQKRKSNHLLWTKPKTWLANLPSMKSSPSATEDQLNDFSCLNGYQVNSNKSSLSNFNPKKPPQNSSDISSLKFCDSLIYPKSTS